MKSNHADPIKKILVKSFLLLALFAEVSVLSAEKPPNVIVIIADDLGWRDSSHYSGPIDTPAIDSLFQEGLELTQFHGRPVCYPSRFAFLTGREGGPGQFISRDKRQLPNLDNIAYAFRDAGYVTALFGKWGFGIVPPTERGFDVCVVNDNNIQQPHSIDGRYETYVIPELVESLPEPYFAVCAFTVPHNPPLAPPEFRTGNSDQDHYDGMVRALDHAVGQLPRDGLTFFFSDNGAQALGRPHPVYRGRKHSLEMGGVICPAVLHGLGEGQIDQMISVRDVWTTMGSLCGAREGGDGINFILDQRKEEVWCLNGGSSWRNQRWHYIRDKDGQEYLYDLIKDPREKKNQITRKKAVRKRARRSLNQEIKNSYYGN